MAEAFVGEIRLFAFGYAPAGWLICDGQAVSIQQYTALYALISNRYGGDGKTNFKLPDLRGRFPTQSGVGPLGTTVLGGVGGTTATTVNTTTSFTISNANQLPSHTHTATFTGTGGGPVVVTPPTVSIKVSNDAAVATPAPAPGATPIANGYLAKATLSTAAQPAIYSATASSMTTLNSATAVATGGSYSGGGITGGTVAVASTGASQAIPAALSFSVPPAMPPFLAMTYAICVSGIYPTQP